MNELHHGNPDTEPDFVFKYNGVELGIETTSLTYDEESGKKDPIGKIRSKIKNKESRPYSTKSCCLVIDISSLNFYRGLLNNFRISISKMIGGLSSDFGIILFSESFHVNQNDNNPRYITQAYDWINIEANPELVKFVRLNQLNSNWSNNDNCHLKLGKRPSLPSVSVRQLRIGNKQFQK